MQRFVKVVAAYLLFCCCCAVGVAVESSNPHLLLALGKLATRDGSTILAAVDTAATDSAVQQLVRVPASVSATSAAFGFMEHPLGGINGVQLSIITTINGFPLKCRTLCTRRDDYLPLN